jgi:hypothetical protein
MKNNSHLFSLAKLLIHSFFYFFLEFRLFKIKKYVCQGMTRGSKISWHDPFNVLLYTVRYKKVS